MNLQKPETRHWAGALAVMMLSAGCVHQPPSVLDDYVSMQRRAMSMDESEWVANKQELTGADGHVRRALLQASPGRSDTDLIAARDSLKEMLSQNAPHSAALRDYMVLTLRAVEHRLTLHSQSEQAAERVRQLEAELASIQARLRSLEEARAEAEHKLRALTKIEKSIDRPLTDQSE